MKYYDSINTATLDRWEKSLDGDFSALRCDPKIGDEESDQEAWEKLYNEYLEKYGIGKHHQRIIDLKIELAELQLEYAIDGNLFLQNQIDDLKDELIEIIKSPSKGSIDDCIYVLARHLKFHLPKKEITLLEFQTYLKGYEREVEEYQNKSTK